MVAYWGLFAVCITFAFVILSTLGRKAAQSYHAHTKAKRDAKALSAAMATEGGHSRSLSWKTKLPAFSKADTAPSSTALNVAAEPPAEESDAPVAARPGLGSVMSPKDRAAKAKADKARAAAQAKADKAAAAKKAKEAKVAAAKKKKEDAAAAKAAKVNVSQQGQGPPPPPPPQPATVAVSGAGAGASSNVV